MKIGILVLSVGSFGNSGSYNLQEVGLAKSFDKLFDEVKVYKLVSLQEKESHENILGTAHASILYLPSKTMGTNGIPNMHKVDSTLDVLICFSDTQLMLPAVYAWTQNNNIKLLSYIGVTESHSTNRVKNFIINVLFQRNIRVYKRCMCLAKTPAVEKELKILGVKSVTVAPVGLDLSLLKQDFKNYNPIELKKKYGYQGNDKVILFVGRLNAEKQPVKMIEIFAELLKADESYRLLMVGNGELQETVEAKIVGLELTNHVQLMGRIPNSDIWELYCIADTFVNLNQQEIFGMAILEAMYYGCKVVAWEAPGPNLIIESGVSGWIVSDNDSVRNRIMDAKDLSDEAHKRIMSEFTWENSAYKIKKLIEKNIPLNQQT